MKRLANRRSESVARRSALTLQNICPTEKPGVADASEVGAALGADRRAHRIRVANGVSGDLINDEPLVRNVIAISAWCWADTRHSLESSSLPVHRKFQDGVIPMESASKASSHVSAGRTKLFKKKMATDTPMYWLILATVHTPRNDDNASPTFLRLCLNRHLCALKHSSGLNSVAFEEFGAPC